jgi:peptidoglycan/xylan/chitin deacetylase (PgdA/CDA1 family)
MRYLAPLVCPVFFLFATILNLQAAGPDARKRVALVIDDGPIPAHNAAFLELLSREHIHVTFSHVGKNVDAHPEMSKAVAAAGHEIINHSYTHPHLNPMSDADIEQEVAKTQLAIQKATGRAPVWFWAPFLEYDGHVAAVVQRVGLEHFPWKKFHFIGSLDWEPKTTGEQFRQLCTTGIVDGTVILMHEWPEVTLANLPAVIDNLKKQGVEFVAFSQLEPRKAVAPKS